MILCTDGLRRIKESVTIAFPKTEYQRYIDIFENMNYCGFTEMTDMSA